MNVKQIDYLQSLMIHTVFVSVDSIPEDKWWQHHYVLFNTHRLLDCTSCFFFHLCFTSVGELSICDPPNDFGSQLLSAIASIAKGEGLCEFSSENIWMIRSSYAQVKITHPSFLFLHFNFNHVHIAD